jgi:hypothetical protein
MVAAAHMLCVGEHASRLMRARKVIPFHMAVRMICVSGIQGNKSQLNTSHVFIDLHCNHSPHIVLKAALDSALTARDVGKIPQFTKIIDLWFFENAVRLHNMGSILGQ